MNAIQTSRATGGFMKRMLDLVEKVGNKVPHPAMIFLFLMAIVIVMSHILQLVGTSVTQQVVDPSS
jgi:aminobenzoyl-glutamate transport protein